MSEASPRGPLQRVVSCSLEFRHQSERPTEDGTYLIYNQCDGFHIAECVLEENGEFVGFHWFAGDYIDDDFYVAWAKLPETELLYPAFADEPTSDKSAHDVCLERLAMQQAAEANAALSRPAAAQDKTSDSQGSA